MTQPQGDKDFFISYRGARTDWALWVNWVVRSAGFSTVLMDEFPIGTNWTEQMREACAHCCRLIPLYSEDYWDSGACRLEFDTYLARHLMNTKARLLLPLVVQKCEVPDMDGTLLRKALHPLNRDAAHAAILKVLEDITPVATAAVPFIDSEPPFPGIASTPTTIVDWPDAVDSLKWPLANHDDARLAFAELVTRSATFRLLAIKGSSETGKSHLTEQFYNNASRRVTVCRCARFDFKGTDQIDQTLATFVQHLDVPLPPADSLSERLRHILQSLTQRQQPSLLIFDTYEDSGEADRWMRESLLTSLHRHPWLRVVIAGQEVPACHGKLWDDDTKVLTLTQPDAVHWHEYAKANGHTMPLRFIKEAHKHIQGKASILAQLCGPKT